MDVKVCPNCGYERQQKDDDAAMVPSNECPKCRIIYDKATSLRSDEERARGLSPNTGGKQQVNLGGGKFLAFVIFALVVIVVLPISVKYYPALKKMIVGEWYKNADGLEQAYKQQQLSGKPILVFFALPS
jgi:hypothetical protein